MKEEIILAFQDTLMANKHYQLTNFLFGINPWHQQYLNSRLYKNFGSA